MAALNKGRIWGEASEKVLVVGLTGGIGSGKTEVAKILQKLGAKVIDADIVAREVVSPGTRAFQKIIEEFGGNILDENGNIDRSKLARIVFSDEKKRKVLNNITHPEVFMRLLEEIKKYASELKHGQVPVVVVDAALIVDAGASPVFDLVLVVTASFEERIKRLVEKRKMEQKEAIMRIKSQIPEKERLKNADIVIENNGTLDDLRKKVEDAWEKICREAQDILTRRCSQGTGT